MASNFRELIESEAARISWDADLLEAQVLVESSGDPYAFRYEPGFYARYIHGNTLYAGWGPLAACSYGLLQVMFASAYEVGFRGRPEDLFVPATGLRWGAVKLASFISKTPTPEAALAAYNGGLGNPQMDYAKRVLAQRDRLVAQRKVS